MTIGIHHRIPGTVATNDFINKTHHIDKAHLTGSDILSLY